MSAGLLDQALNPQPCASLVLFQLGSIRPFQKFNLLSHDTHVLILCRIVQQLQY